MWVWVLSVSLVGASPEHTRIAKFKTKQECQSVLQQRISEEQLKGRILVGSCFYTKN